MTLFYRIKKLDNCKGGLYHESMVNHQAHDSFDDGGLGIAEGGVAVEKSFGGAEAQEHIEAYRHMV